VGAAWPLVGSPITTAIAPVFCSKADEYLHVLLSSIPKDIEKYAFSSIAVVIIVLDNIESIGLISSFSYQVGIGMAICYCSLHARLFIWAQHTWADFPREKITEIKRYYGILRSARGEAPSLGVVEAACDECIRSIQPIYGTALNDIDSL